MQLSSRSSQEINETKVKSVILIRRHQFSHFHSLPINNKLLPYIKRMRRCQNEAQL